MYQRITDPILSKSFFLFGARGTGKSTFLSLLFTKQTLWFDLLDPEIEEELALHPNSLKEQIMAKPETEWVVIDEIQKNPKLLDIVHHLIENTNLKFALTGSSARKLKRGSANLLAGRAFVNYLFPLISLELKKDFNLEHCLNWGSLPEIYKLPTELEKQEYLRSYALTYLKEEIWSEHLIRKINPFRKFLEIAAQSNCEIVNYSNIARDVGTDIKTVQSYYEILEDTLLGFLLPAYHLSVRKQQRQSPKFYFFDLGVKRALDKTLTRKIEPNSYSYGKAFEHFLISEIHHLNLYLRKDFKLSYLLTKDRSEIDLIIDRPNASTLLIEIKSAKSTDKRFVSTIQRFAKDIPNSEALILSQDPKEKLIDDVKALPWQKGIDFIFDI